MNNYWPQKGTRKITKLWSLIWASHIMSIIFNTQLHKVIAMTTDVRADIYWWTQISPYSEMQAQQKCTWWWWPAFSTALVGVGQFVHISTSSEKGKLIYNRPCRFFATIKKDQTALFCWKTILIWRKHLHWSLQWESFSSWPSGTAGFCTTASPCQDAAEVIGWLLCSHLPKELGHPV